MEHLLFLVHRMPYPPNKGDKIRSWHLLRHLAERYRVHLGTFIDDPSDWQHVGVVEALCASSHFARLNPRTARLRSLGALTGGRPLTLDYYRNAGLASWIGNVMQQHPVRRVLVFSSAMAQYAAPLAQATRVIDFVDIDSDKWRQYADKKPWPMRWLYQREGRQLLAYERRIAAEFDASLFVSQAEADLFRQLAPESAARIGHFNNGVDTDYFSPHREYENPYAGDEMPIVFTGAMDYWPNVDAVQWFAREVMPSVLARHPAARFYIVGTRPGPQVQALARLPGVRVTGAVPDVRPYLAHARMSVAPLRIARGIQNKVLEAMSMALPVVVSPQALEGIDATPGKEVMLADQPAQYADTVSGLLALPDAALGNAARTKVQTCYGWSANLAEVDRSLASAPHAAEKIADIGMPLPASAEVH